VVRAFSYLNCFKKTYKALLLLGGKRKKKNRPEGKKRKEKKNFAFARPSLESYDCK